MGSKLSPYCVGMLVNNYIGKEIYFKASKEMKNILIADAMKQFQLEMIQRFGSLRNYQRDWMKRKGFNSDKEYIELYLAPSVGVKTYNEYQIECAKEKGFKSRYDRMLKKANFQGYKTLHKLYLDRYKKRGFKNQNEYRKFLAERKGFQNYNQLLNYNQNEKRNKISN